MGIHYPIEIKEKLVKLYFDKKETLDSLQKIYGISKKTIFNWVRKERLYHTQSNDVLHTRGRKKEDETSYKERYEILKKYQTFLKAQRERK